MIEVILLEKNELGGLGDKARVKPGYWRNYLLPKSKAVRATKENLELFSARRAELEQLAKEAFDKANARAESLTNFLLTLPAKAADEGKLFGSIGARDISVAATQAGMPIEKREVLLPNGPLRELGEYEIEVKLHADLVGLLKVVIVPESN